MRTVGAWPNTGAEHGQQAYKGATVAGFPNLFMLVGPNTGVGNSSMIYMIESQLHYLLDALRAMDRYQLATVEVRDDSLRRYNVDLQRRMTRTVWSTGCSSWYQDATGRNTTLWPTFGFLFRLRTRHFDLPAYLVTMRAAAGAVAVEPAAPVGAPPAPPSSVAASRPFDRRDRTAVDADQSPTISAAGER